MQKNFTAGKPYIIPPRPETLVNVIAALERPEVDVDEVVLILQQDVSLYSAVLATANTPLFSPGKKVTSLKQSVMRLGFSKMITILRILALKTALSRVDRLDTYWNTATEIAQLSVKIFQLISTHSVDNAYSLGMMHNCGIPLMMEAIPQYRDFIESGEKNNLHNVITLENERYKVNHFQVSAEIAKRWLMPDSVVIAIDLQSTGIERAQLDCSDNEESKMLFCALLLAKEMSTSYHNYWDITEQDDHLEALTPALHFIGMSQTDYLDVRDTCLGNLEDN